MNQSKEVIEFSKQIKEKMKEIDTFGKSCVVLLLSFCHVFFYFAFFFLLSSHIIICCETFKVSFILNYMFVTLYFAHLDLEGNTEGKIRATEEVDKLKEQRAEEQVLLVPLSENYHTGVADRKSVV